MGGSNFGRSRQPQRTRRSPTCRPIAAKGGNGESQNTPFPMTPTPKSPDRTIRSRPPPQQNRRCTEVPQSRIYCVRGSRGAEPPGLVSAAAEGRRR